MGQMIGFKVTQEAREQDSLLSIVEYLSNDVITISGHDGRPRSFRKFLLLGNWGIADKTGQYVIIPALTNHSQLEILFTAKVIVAGAFFAGWNVYSLDGEKLDCLPPMPLALATKLARDKFSRN